MENSKKLNWNNLRNNNCPKCAKPLWFDSGEEMVMCEISCGFMISQKRMLEIVASKNERIIKREPRNYDNFSALQNMGHEPEAEQEPPDWL